MSKFKSEFLNVLSERGFVHQISDAEALDAAALAGPITAYIGFDAISTTAEEAKNPQRDLPIGIIASLSICTVLYIAVAAVLTGLIPSSQIDIHAPVADALRTFARRTGTPRTWARRRCTPGSRPPPRSGKGS